LTSAKNEHHSLSTSDEFLEKLKRFAAEEFAIVAIVVVGSYARGTAGADSDIDLVLITNNRAQFLDERRWIEQFGKVDSCELEDYGLVQSLRVFFENGPEVEFGITSLDWVAETELGSTGAILAGGYLVIYDPTNIVDAFYRRAVAADIN